MSTSTPRRKRLKREARLQSAKSWVRSYSGRDIVKGYRKWYGVSTVCAIIELRLLGIAVPETRLCQAKTTEEQAARQRAARKQVESTDDSTSDSDGTFAYIAGYTEGGVPYGVRWEEMATAEDEAAHAAGSQALPIKWRS